MSIADVVPVAVPYTPGKPSSVRVPSDTHLLHWCVLRPAVSNSASHSSAREHGARRSKILSALVEDVDSSLTVDSRAVGSVRDIVRSEEGSALCCWNITEPLSSGTHTATLTLSFESTTDTDGPPACVAAPDGTALPWNGAHEVSIRTKIAVVPEERDSFEMGSDPLWGRRDIYRSRYADADER